VPPIIEVDRLSKSFGDITAIDGVSFTVGAGEIFGFLGRTAPASRPPSKFLRRS